MDGKLVPSPCWTVGAVMSVMRTVMRTVAAISRCSFFSTVTFPVFLSTVKKLLKVSSPITSLPCLSKAVMGSVAAKFKASEELTSGSRPTRVWTSVPIEASSIIYKKK